MQVRARKISDENILNTKDLVALANVHRWAEDWLKRKTGKTEIKRDKHSRR